MHDPRFPPRHPPLGYGLPGQLHPAQGRVVDVGAGPGPAPDPDLMARIAPGRGDFPVETSEAAEFQKTQAMIGPAVEQIKAIGAMPAEEREAMYPQESLLRLEAERERGQQLEGRISSQQARNEYLQDALEGRTSEIDKPAPEAPGRLFPRWRFGDPAVKKAERDAAGAATVRKIKNAEAADKKKRDEEYEAGIQRGIARTSGEFEKNEQIDSQVTPKGPRVNIPEVVWTNPETGKKEVTEASKRYDPRTLKPVPYTDKRGRPRIRMVRIAKAGATKVTLPGEKGVEEDVPPVEDEPRFTEVGKVASDSDGDGIPDIKDPTPLGSGRVGKGLKQPPGVPPPTDPGEAFMAEMALDGATVGAPPPGTPGFLPTLTDDEIAAELGQAPFGGLPHWQGGRVGERPLTETESKGRRLGGEPYTPKSLGGPIPPYLRNLSDYHDFLESKDPDKWRKWSTKPITRESGTPSGKSSGEKAAAGGTPQAEALQPEGITGESVATFKNWSEVTRALNEPNRTWPDKIIVAGVEYVWDAEQSKFVIPSEGEQAAALQPEGTTPSEGRIRGSIASADPRVEVFGGSGSSASPIVAQMGPTFDADRNLIPDESVVQAREFDAEGNLIEPDPEEGLPPYEAGYEGIPRIRRIGDVPSLADVGGAVAGLPGKLKELIGGGMERLGGLSEDARDRMLAELRAGEEFDPDSPDPSRHPGYVEPDPDLDMEAQLEKEERRGQDPRLTERMQERPALDPEAGYSPAELAILQRSDVHGDIDAPPTVPTEDQLALRAKEKQRLESRGAYADMIRHGRRMAEEQARNAPRFWYKRTGDPKSDAAMHIAMAQMMGGVMGEQVKGRAAVMGEQVKGRTAREQMLLQQVQYDKALKFKSQDQLRQIASDPMTPHGMREAARRQFARNAGLDVPADGAGGGGSRIPAGQAEAQLEAQNPGMMGQIEGAISEYNADIGGHGSIGDLMEGMSGWFKGDVQKTNSDQLSYMAQNLAGLISTGQITGDNIALVGPIIGAKLNRDLRTELGRSEDRLSRRGVAWSDIQQFMNDLMAGRMPANYRGLVSPTRTGGFLGMSGR